MRGRSVSIFPLSTGADSVAIAKQLEEVFGADCLEDGERRLELQLALKVRRET